MTMTMTMTFQNLNMFCPLGLILEKNVQTHGFLSRSIVETSSEATSAFNYPINQK